MIKKLSAEEQIATMQRLINFGVNEGTSRSSVPVIELKKKAANGKTYGIVHESNKFYIMEAPQKDTEVLAEDFNYIGGFNNRKENEYSSYAKAANALDIKLMAINETVNKKDRVIIEAPTVKAEWEDQITESMRNEINRFKTITSNVAQILKEDKSSYGSVPAEHTLPEAPATHPSDKKVNAPFTDTAVAKGEKDFKKEEHNHETAGTPFNVNGEVSNKEMQSDKKPVVKTDATYIEKAKYAPENSVADKKPSGGKVVRVEESNNKVRLKLTEEQVLAWSKNKDYLDTSKGTEIGSSAPYEIDVDDSKEHLQENDSIIYDNATDPNNPTPGTSEVGDGKPYGEVNEATVDAEDAAGMPDDEEDYDYPFPEVEDDIMDDDSDENEYELTIDDNDLNNDFVERSRRKFGKDGMAGLENWEEDWNKIDDDDFEDGGFGFDEGYTRRGRRMSEAKLNAFGKHPAYRKSPMTTPPNKEVAINGARVWDDESALGEEPFGEKIGDGLPYSEIVDDITESIMSTLYHNKKKV